MVPRQPGDRVKNDKRDALRLAFALRAGAIDGIHVPTIEDEATRDFLRARDDLRLDVAREKHRLSKFLLRQNVIYPGKKQWSLDHKKWLKSVTFENPLQQSVLEMHYHRVLEYEERLWMMDERIKQVAESPQYAVAVGRLRCFRGIDYLTALNLVVEVGDFTRFKSAAAFMAYLGLIPSEHSSGSRTVRGAITKTGNKHLRRLLIESAWHYRHQYTVSRRLSERRKGQDDRIIALADKAMRRLGRKYRTMQARRKSHNKTVVAIARELSGFIWGVMTEPA